MADGRVASVNESSSMINISPKLLMGADFIRSVNFGFRSDDDIIIVSTAN